MEAKVAACVHRQILRAQHRWYLNHQRQHSQSMDLEAEPLAIAMDLEALVLEDLQRHQPRDEDVSAQRTCAPRQRNPSSPSHEFGLQLQAPPYQAP
jgi:hypothetical protein